MAGAAPIRVALALNYFDADRGGSETWATHFAAWLSKRNYEVSIVATEGRPSPDVRLHTASAPLHPWRRARILTALAASLKVDLIHDTGVLLAADVFHPHMGSRFLNLKREIAARPLAERLRLAVSPGLARWLLQTRRLEKRQLRSARKIIAASRLVASDLRRTKACKADRMDIIHHGIRNAAFENASGDTARLAARRGFGLRDEILFVVSAHNFLLKGVGAVIDALAVLTPEERARIKVYVAGNGDIARYRKYAVRCGVEGCIYFMGSVADMAGLYRAADVALHPTFHDACSLSTLEAIASGIPVITTAFNGAADFIDHEKDGIVLPSPDKRLLAAAMRRMLPAEERQRFKEALKGKAHLVSQDINFERIEAVYRQVLFERQGQVC
ncbi:MAG: glycosyltransferase family 4 protein [Alphaproteobacteria bacterium]|nr:glycosyltransferase family 4 protein [Alphaproteobacteria bacterium]